jgi:hypothetical protein
MENEMKILDYEFAVKKDTSIESGVYSLNRAKKTGIIIIGNTKKTDEKYTKFVVPIIKVSIETDTEEWYKIFNKTKVCN